MRTDEHLWQALQMANPVPGSEHPLDDPQELAMRYDTLTSKRDHGDSSPMQTPRAVGRPRRAWLAASAGFVIVLIAIGIASFIGGELGSGSTGPADGIESTVVTTTSAPPASGAPETPPPSTFVPPAVPPGGGHSFTGQYFAGQQRWEEPAVFLDSHERPAVFLGLAAPGWAPPLEEAAIADCGDDECTTMAVHGFPALEEASTRYVLADGSPSNVWSAAVRRDGTPVFAVVSVDGVNTAGSGSFDTTITLLTCDDYLCFDASETEIVRVSSDTAREPGSGLPVPADVSLALGSRNQPMVAFSGWYGTVTEINDAGVWREDSGSALAIAVCADASCTEEPHSTVVERLESADGFIATYWKSSLVPGADDHAIVMYGRIVDPSGTTGETRIGACRDESCGIVDVTTVETWLNTNTGGPVMTLGADDLPVIAHWRWWEEPKPTVLTICRTASCTGAIDTALPGFGARVNLSMSGEGFPVLTMLADGKATVLSCGNAECTDYVLGTPLGDSSSQGFPSFVAPGDGLPYLASFDVLTQGALHVYRCVDASCTSVQRGADSERLVAVPDFEGFFDGDTSAWAESAGLVLVVVGEVPADPAQAVEILRQEPVPGTLVVPGTEVTIWLASG